MHSKDKGLWVHFFVEKNLFADMTKFVFEFAQALSAVANGRFHRRPKRHFCKMQCWQPKILPKGRFQPNFALSKSHLDKRPQKRTFGVKFYISAYRCAQYAKFWCKTHVGVTFGKLQTYTENMKNSFPQRVRFVGIGGIGMSALARYLLHCGCQVSGSDRQENAQTQKLRSLGVAVDIPHNAAGVKDADLVVRTSAVPESNTEVLAAMRQGTPVVLREQLLGQIFDRFPCRIAVCGTHGKTTVTAMLHHVLERCGVAHTAFIGGEYDGENCFFGDHTVVAEACEYNRSFLNLHPTLCLCLNAEFDHPDCYKDVADVRQAFVQLFEQSQTVVCHSSVRQFWGGGVVFGETGLTAHNVVSSGCPRFDLYDGGQYICGVRLAVCGLHNVDNALAVLAACKQLGLPLLQVAQALFTFRGVDRRWTKANCRLNVVCDYAHHPTEIAAAVQTAKSLCRGKTVCVFQPHTYSRTKAFWDEFVTCFDGADQVVYLPVYSARENPLPGVTSFGLFRRAKLLDKNAKYFADFQRAANYLNRHVSPNDLVVLIGAGDVNTLADLLN